MCTAGSPRPLCLLPASLAAPNGDERSAGGGRWGLGCYSVHLKRGRVCLDPSFNLCRLLSSLKEKICVRVMWRSYSPLRMHKSPRRARECTLARQCSMQIIARAHTRQIHTDLMTLRRRSPQGAGCLDKTKQMFTCTMSPRCQRPRSCPPRHVILVCSLDLGFLSLCCWVMCDKTRDKTTCVTAGMFGIYAVRFHHLFQPLAHMAGGAGGGGGCYYSIDER